MSKMGGLVLILGGLAVAAYVMPRTRRERVGGGIRKPTSPRALGSSSVPARTPRGQYPSRRSARVHPAPRQRPSPRSPRRSWLRSRRAPSMPRHCRPGLRPSLGIATRSRASCRRSSGASAAMMASSTAHGRQRPAGHEGLHRSRQRQPAGRGARPVLFTMVQGRAGQGMRQAMPGWTGSERGRPCLPDPILARAAKKGSSLAGLPKAARPSPDSNRVVDDHHGRRPRKLRRQRGAGSTPGAGSVFQEGRMALAGPAFSRAAAPGAVRARDTHRKAHAPPPPRVTQAAPRGDNWTRTIFNRQ